MLLNECLLRCFSVMTHDSV